MPKAIAQGDTFLKKQILAASTLPNSDKIFIKKGQEIAFTQYAPAKDQHVSLTLASPLTTVDGKNQLQQVFAYEPHLKVVEDPTSKLIKLPVTYRSQVDNEEITGKDGTVWYANRQCNTTSNTMLADYLLGGALSKLAKDKNFPEPESIYMRVVRKYGDTTDHSAQTQALKELQIESYFSYSLSLQDILTSLVAGIPVVVGLEYKQSGHIVLVVGHDPVAKMWLIHDPYGIRYGASNVYDIGADGSYDQYSYPVFQQLFLPDNTPEEGWGRIVTSVRGKPTGLPANL